MEIEKNPNFLKQLDELLQKEKTARQNNENTILSKLLCEVVQLCYEFKDYEELFKNILSLSKKRGQSKKAMIDMVQLCMKFIDQIDNMDVKMKLISTLKDVCDKKIYLEVEYARCCLMTVKHREDENNINEAAKIMQEVQVETYGSMDKREKLEFILYQMRVMIKKSDYIRLFIISKKINRKSLEDENLEDLKILYYSYMINYYNHENCFIDASDCYKQIFDTLDKKLELQEKLPKKIDFHFNINVQNVLENYVVFLALSPYCKDRIQMINELNLNYPFTLEKYPRLLNIVNCMLSTELISTKRSDYAIEDIEIFSKEYENSEIHKENFEKQLIQHNLRLIEKYYDCIYLPRISELLNISTDRIETEICEMINDKTINGKIDRIDQFVNFNLKKNENQVLNEWVYDLNKVLNLVDETCNLISREKEPKKMPA